MTRPQVRTLAAADWPAFVAELEGAGVVDLTLSSWRPRQPALELARQAGIVLPSPAPLPPRDPRSAETQAAIMGDGIDREAAGALAWRQAEEDAQRLAPHLRRVVVLEPGFGFAWRADDKAIVTRLAAAGLTVERVAVKRGAEASALPVSIVPGLVEAGWVDALDARQAHRLPGGVALVAPLLRCDPRVAARSLFGVLSGRAAGDGWLRAYCATFGHALFNDPDLLLEAASTAHAAGATELALDLLDRGAVRGRTAIERGIAAAQAQGIRIAAHRFAEAAAAPDPGEGVPEELALAIRHLRAWGQVMSGAADRSAEMLDPLAAALARKPAPSTYDLYMLNIAALSKLRRGLYQEAETIEALIDQRRRDGGIADGRLAYVNLLNRSRLRRRAGDDAGALALQREAFATSQGVTTSWEAFHLALLEAQLAKSAGDARREWLRAALIWLSEPVREACPDRALRALRPALDATLPAAPQVEARLTAALGAAPDPQPFGFARFVHGMHVTRVLDMPVAALGWSDRPSDGDSPLAAAATAMLRELGGDAQGGTILVDLARGRGLESGAAAACSLTHRTGLAGGVLPRVGRNAALLALTPEGDGGIALWRRHLPPRRLPAEMMRLIGRAEAGDIVETDLPALLALENEAILTLDWRDA